MKTTSPSDYGRIACLCRQYLEYHQRYLAGKPVDASQELDSLLQALECAIAPVTFMQSLERTKG